MTGGDYTLPIKPKFIKEFVVLRHGDGLLVDGTTEIHQLSGSAARELVPRLIPLLDGERNVADLETHLTDISPQHIRDTVALLWNCGLIEDVSVDSGDDHEPETQTISFFRRFLGETRTNRSGKQAYRRLREAQLWIYEPESHCGFGNLLKTMLIGSGVGNVELVDRSWLNHLKELPLESTKRPIVIYFAIADEYPELQCLVDRTCYEAGVSWLRTVLDLTRNRADIGPLFSPTRLPCFQCFHAMQATQSLPATDLHKPTNSTYATWASLVGIEVLYMLSKLASCHSDRGFRRYFVKTWDFKDLQYARLPGCPRCWPANKELNAQLRPNADSSIDPAQIFEDFIWLQSCEVSNAKFLQERVNRGAALATQAKHLPACEQYPLTYDVMSMDQGILDAMARLPASRSGKLTSRDLATLLMLAGGLRGWHPGAKKITRWAPTGGNLGSVELYIAARNIEGLGPGIYFYQIQEHALAAIRWRSGGMEVEEVIRRATHYEGVRQPDLVIFFTSAFHRLRHKYGDFGYKLINFDAGVAISQLQTVASSLQLNSLVLTNWADDIIEEQLGLSWPGEQCTGVVALSCEPHLSNGPTHGADSFRSARPTAEKHVRDFFELTTTDIRNLLCEESRQKEWHISPSASHDSVDVFGHGWSEQQQTLQVYLPPAASGGTSVKTVLSARRTVRNYAPDPVRMSQLSNMLHYAYKGDLLDWPEEHRVDLSLAFYVVANNVADLGSGLYRFDPQRHCLILENSHALSANALQSILQQSGFARAPVQVWIIGNLAAASRRDGIFGYGKLLLRSGMAVHRLCLGATEGGLDGAIVAGIVQDQARTVLGFDGYEQFPLIAFVAGYASTNSYRRP